MIRVDAFHPFKNRRDSVLALRFAYDAATVARLKALLRECRDIGLSNPGGWLPDYECWFIERDAWPVIRQGLIRDGHDIAET